MTGGFDAADAAPLAHEALARRRPAAVGAVALCLHPACDLALELECTADLEALTEDSRACRRRASTRRRLQWLLWRPSSRLTSAR